VTGGASGYLRQEFQELEILDEVTRLRYENKLPDGITGDRRNVVIHQFRNAWVQDMYQKNVHTSIRWDGQDPLMSLLLQLTHLATW